MYLKRNSINLLISLLFLCILTIYLGIFFWWIQEDLGTIKAENAEFIKFKRAKRKIHVLTSLLKRYNVSEKEFSDNELPKIYVITPTFARPVQKAELTRLKNVFLHIAALHWIVVEDASEKSTLVRNFLLYSGISFTHLFKETPPQWKLDRNDPRWYKPRGVLQRNEGIRWLRENLSLTSDGVVYFADDDNTYSIELFEEMRNTRRVSVWPVGLVGGVMVERPTVTSEDHVSGFIVGWRPDRAFPIDMAGFAVSLPLIMKTEATFSLDSKRGFIESDFLEKIAYKHDLEPKADRCTKVLVWHTQTKDPNLEDEQRLKSRGQDTDREIEV